MRPLHLFHSNGNNCGREATIKGLVNIKTLRLYKDITVVGIHQEFVEMQELLCQQVTMVGVTIMFVLQ